jgi:hypothetical protein
LATAAAGLPMLRERARRYREGAHEQYGRQPSGNFCHDEKSSTSFAPPACDPSNRAVQSFKPRKGFVRSPRWTLIVQM